MKTKLAVLCDFDDTIIQQNLGVLLLEKFGTPDWKQYHPMYLAGKMSLRESLTREYACLQASPESIDAFVQRNGTLRPGFLEFVSFCREERLPFTIVTSGLDVYVKPFLRRYGLTDVEVFSERALFTPIGVSLVPGVGNGACQNGNSCKCFYLQRRQQDGHKVVYVGDGVSDYCPAAKADYVFARRKLLAYCQERGVPCTPFEGFADVISGIKALRETV